MEQFERKQQDYTKWNEEIWLSVEKPISVFQMRVAECMFWLGDLQKRNVNDFEIKPCLNDQFVLGDNFYVEMIRPQCVKEGFLDKRLPTEADLQDEDSDQDSDEDEQEEMKEEKKEKPSVQEKVSKPEKKGKKGGKGGKSSQQEKKLKIVKDNFMKQSLDVFTSFSKERMQVQFAFKAKKLEMKLITFFYIAYYIRKNKVKDNIQEQQIYQFINILIKVVKIFDGYRGTSFLNNEGTVQISKTLILDLKLCIKGMRDYYNYTNKKVIINYPKLVYYTSYDRFFPTLDIRPYPSQVDFMQSVKRALNENASIENPTLIFYKTMIGSGKTSASLALSQLIRETKLVDAKNSKYQLLYSCVIGSVRIQVGRYAYNKSQKFALAAMEQSIKQNSYYYPRIINSYSCKNEKNVDLLISDLHCSYAMMDYHDFSKQEKEIFEFEASQRKNDVNIGRLDRENVILFIDEPTAFCKSVDSPAVKRLFDILANYPPKVTILASATMPDKSELPKTIKLIERKNPNLQVFQVESKEFQIGCQYCSFSGQVVFPHTGVKNKEQLSHVISLLEKNPFLLRLYTGPSLFFLLKKCYQKKLKGLPKIDQMPQVRQQDIIKATFKILKILINEDDEVIADICELSAEEANLDYKVEDQKDSDSDDEYFMEEENKEQAEKTQKAQYVNFQAMIKKDAYKFLGGCLIATSNPKEFVTKYFSKWVRKIKPVRRLFEKYQKHAEYIDKEIKKVEDDQQMREQKKIKEITKLQFTKEANIDIPDKKKINTLDHYEKYCVNKNKNHQSMLIKHIPFNFVSEDLLAQTQDFLLKLLLCGVAVYAKEGLSAIYLDKVEELASQNHIAYIVTDQSLCYGTNFPISNVIICDDLVVKLNMNEMFQLVGRAGRVGQSWTARAFLQKEGLKKLSHYIHSKEQIQSDEAKVFEELAQWHLDNPELKLRTAKSQIRYTGEGEKIEIVIKKKKVEDYLVFRNVAIVGFMEEKILTHKLPYKTFDSYELPSSAILYEDLPTTLNSEEVPIIDVEAYQKKEQEFIRKTLNNAVKRIMREQLGGILDEGVQMNEFKPKVYEDFFCKQTCTFAVLVKGNMEKNYSKYEWQRMKKGENFTEEYKAKKLETFLFECRKIAEMVRTAPTEILSAENVKCIRAEHENLFDKIPFYREIYEVNLKDAEIEYNKLVQKIGSKDSIEHSKQSIIALIFDNYPDMDKINDKLFHIDRQVRQIWNSIEKHME